jgi:quinohemoprotein ethanol dehydrogenase
MDIELADLTIGGERVPVLMQAPKNGFFYVIDRRNGRLISAEKFAPVNWAERIDMATGRPVENPAARFTGGSAFLAFPSIWGAHGVEAMSYNPGTGLVYLPARNLGYVYTDPPDLATWSHRRGMFTNSGLGAPPANITIPPGEGWLSAWDPVKQKEAWRVPLTATHNGGTLTTAGNLVFQGLQSGELVAYAADTGRKVWSFDAQTGIMSHPISYLAGGKQYVTLQVGYRASGHRGPGEAWDYYQQKRRVLTFVLDGAAKLPPAQFEKRPIVDVPGFVVDADKVAVGRGIYGRNCGVCHGMGTYSGGAGPDLAKSSVAADPAGFTSVVRDGALRQRGMGSFENLTPAEIEGLYHYIRQAARERLQAQK